MRCERKCLSGVRRVWQQAASGTFSLSPLGGCLFYCWTALRGTPAPMGTPRHDRRGPGVWPWDQSHPHGWEAEDGAWPLSLGVPCCWCCWPSSAPPCPGPGLWLPHQSELHCLLGWQSIEPPTGHILHRNTTVPCPGRSQLCGAGCSFRGTPRVPASARRSSVLTTAPATAIPHGPSGSIE